MKFTTTFMWIITTIVIVVDIVLAINKNPSDTISQVMLAYSYQYSTLPLAWGVLTGHLFWPSKVFRTSLGSIITLVIIASALLVVDLTSPFNIAPLWPMAVGIVCGHVFWPQPTKEIK